MAVPSTETTRAAYAALVEGYVLSGLSRKEAEAKATETIMIDPLVTNSFKEYTPDELAKLKEHIQDTLEWMMTNNLHTASSEDVMALRVGIPYIGSDTAVTAETIYVPEGTFEKLVPSIGVDVIKFTVNTPDTSKPSHSQMTSYTYKAPYIHRILGRYFVDGIDNQTGYSYLDNVDVGMSALGSIPVQYNGVEQTPPVRPEELPYFVLKCFTYIIQNPRLITTVLDEERVNAGDMMYYRTKDIFDALVRAKLKADNKAPDVSEEDLPPSLEAAIEEIFENTGLDESFKTLQYGGLLDSVRVVIRIPASRTNQELLEGLLRNDAQGNPEVFSDIFKEEFVQLTDLEASESARSEDLEDEYSDVKGAGFERLDDVASGMYGCRTTRLNAQSVEETVYRHWYVSDNWLMKCDAEVASVIFWTGFDMAIDRNTNPCPYDKLLVIVVIVIMTVIAVISAGTLASPALQTIATVLAIASGIVSIGMTMGVFSKEDSAIALAVIGALSLGTMAWSAAIQESAIGMQQAMQLTLQTGSVAFQCYKTYEDIQYQEEVEDKQKEINALLGEDSSFYESDMRYVLGGYTGLPEGYDWDGAYRGFASYKNPGFQDG